MNLIYFDETGNTGTNLTDMQQPIFVLAALIVPEDSWQKLEHDLSMAVDEFFPEPRPDPFEIHATILRNGNDREGYIRGISLGKRQEFRDAWLNIAFKRSCTLMYRAIVKTRFDRWVRDEFGPGVRINPHIVAFPLVARVVDDYLKSTANDSLGIFIFDENKEVVHDIEKSVAILRGIESSVRLSNVIEKGFFIESHKSLILQLCDVCAYTARKKEEHKEGLKVRPYDLAGIKGIDALTHKRNEQFLDVIGWIMEQQKK